MRKTWLALLLAPTLAFARPPRLVLFVSVDSMGTDVFLRSRAHFKAGLAGILAQGAFFPNAHYAFAHPATAPGHTTLLTGANPWRHGIVSNTQVNRATGQTLPVFADADHPVLEAPKNTEDVSPQNLLAETLADRLREATWGKGKVVALAVKPRAAISMAGRLGQAWWFSNDAGKFVSGTWYTKEFPAWVKAFNDKKHPDAFYGKAWSLSMPPKDYAGEDNRSFEEDLFGLGRAFPHPLTGGLPGPGPQYYRALQAAPAMSDILVQLAKAALEGEKLGKDEAPDLLAVSFSPIDVAYHVFGPYSWEVQDAMARLDRAIGELVAACEKAAGGKANLTVVVTADHGGAAIPEEWSAAGLPAGRVRPQALAQGLSKELASRFGADPVAAITPGDLYLSTKVLADKKLDGAAVRRAAAQWLQAQAPIQLAVAKDDLDSPSERAGYARALRKGYFADRSGDVVFVLKPFQVLDEEGYGTAHGQPYSYDDQVPVLFAGKGIRPGYYPQAIDPVDVAPTLASVLEMGAPASAEGAPRAEALSGK